MNKPSSNRGQFSIEVFTELQRMGNSAQPSGKPASQDPDVRRIEFDKLAGNDVVWRQADVNPESQGGFQGFSVVFLNGRLHLVYDEPDFGTEASYEPTDKELDELLFLLVQFKNWLRNKTS